MENKDINLIQQMVDKAREARQNAYAPYSNYHVGACLRSENNKLFAGCNVENVSYSLTLCAETSAIAALITAGEKRIHEVVVMGSGDELGVPCGACRQRLLEFAASPDIPVHLSDGYKVVETVTLRELLPRPFGPKHLEGLL